MHADGSGRPKVTNAGGHGDAPLPAWYLMQADVPGSEACRSFAAPRIRSTGWSPPDDR
jgi:hypothetical protein